MAEIVIIYEEKYFAIEVLGDISYEVTYAGPQQ